MIRSSALFMRIATVCALAVIAACSGAKEDAKDAKEGAKAAAKGEAKADAKAEDKKAPAAVAASIDTVRLGSFDETVDGVGSVVPRTGHVALLAAPAQTRVVKIFVSAGDHVKTNAPLIDLEQPSFEAAVSSAEATLRVAEQSAARATRLVAAGIAPRKDADIAAAELETAKATALNARRARDLSHVRAPFAGVVTRLTAVSGANVDVGQPLIEITDPSVLDLLLPVSPASASSIRPGQAVDLFEGNSAEGSAIGRATVADVSAAVDSASRGVPVRLFIVSSKRMLRVGESIFVRLVVNKHRNVVVISDDALVPTGEGFHVFVVDSAGVAHSRDVKLGGRAEHKLWISEGLKAGEIVVTKGAFGMDEGARVVGAKP